MRRRAFIYHCHGAGCGFSGGAGTLARELGLAARLTTVEHRALRQSQKRADLAACNLYERVKARRFELLDELRGLGRTELQAHEAGMDHPATWDALALVYGNRSPVLAELAILENRGNCVHGDRCGEGGGAGGGSSPWKGSLARTAACRGGPSS